MVRRTIASAYIIGYDEIEVIYDSPNIEMATSWKYTKKDEVRVVNVMELVQNIVGNLIGMEISIQRKNSLVYGLLLFTICHRKFFSRYYFR